LSSFVISSYVSGESLLPQVPRLRYQFCAGFLTNIDEFLRVNASLELLPYSLGAASLAMFDLARDQIAIVSAKAAVEKPGTISELRESQRNMLGYRLDAFLDAARRAQNGLIPYLRRKFPDLRINKSLAKVVGHITKGTLALPEPLKSDILAYWDAHGATLKSYRDLSQHYLIVGTEAKVFVPSEGHPALMFCLPNNPSARPISNLRYDNPQVHVQDFVREQFLHLLVFCYSILEQLLDPQSTSALIPAIGGRTPLRIGLGAGTEAYPLPDVGDIENHVQSTLNKLHAHFNAKRCDA